MRSANLKTALTFITISVVGKLFKGSNALWATEAKNVAGPCQ